MTKPSVRGACPSLLEPMETGDGLLARILTAGPMKLKALAGLCTAARTHGNGTMEISARGNFQIRGLAPNMAPRLADRLIEVSASIAATACRLSPTRCRAIPAL